jgi:hypothetical protein
MNQQAREDIWKVLERLAYALPTDVYGSDISRAMDDIEAVLEKDEAG